MQIGKEHVTRILRYVHRRSENMRIEFLKFFLTTGREMYEIFDEFESRIFVCPILCRGNYFYQ